MRNGKDGGQKSVAGTANESHQQQKRQSCRVAVPVCELKRIEEGLNLKWLALPKGSETGKSVEEAKPSQSRCVTPSGYAEQQPQQLQQQQQQQQQPQQQPQIRIHEPWSV